MNAINRIPEHKLAEGLFFDPLAASKVVAAILRSPNATVGPAVMEDIRRQEDMSPERFEEVLKALRQVGVIQSLPESPVSLAVSMADATSHCSFLRGLAQAKYLHRDANQIEITLSPPMHPSRLMERLPSAGFGWARLHDTRDSLHSLARKSKKRLVIMSPFLDEHGIEWAEELFRAPELRVSKVLIVRATDPSSLRALQSKRVALEHSGVELLRYAIQHEWTERDAVLESFHAKIILCDGLHAYVGSSNMNRASRDISLECGVTISGPAVRPVVTLVDSIISVATPI